MLQSVAMRRHESARERGSSPRVSRSSPRVSATVLRAPARHSVLLKLKPLVFAICLIPAARIVWSTYEILSGKSGLTDLGANPITKIEIQTGLWTLRFLAITLSLTPIRQIFGIGVLAKYRRMFGLFTFFYACIHVTTWVAVDWFFDIDAMIEEVVKHKYILVGMATFLTLVPLAITSTKGWVRRLGGARWAKLHRLVYLAAIGGTVHYLWAVKKDTLFPLAYLATFTLLLGYRVVYMLRHRRARVGAPGRPGVIGAGSATAD
jgi:sulfoxide reductase heme-binding subunit YedZ